VLKRFVRGRTDVRSGLCVKCQQVAVGEVRVHRLRVATEVELAGAPSE
jgi:hypothetical protein